MRLKGMERERELDPAKRSGGVFRGEEKEEDS